MGVHQKLNSGIHVPRYIYIYIYIYISFGRCLYGPQDRLHIGSNIDFDMAVQSEFQLQQENKFPKQSLTVGVLTGWNKRPWCNGPLVDDVAEHFAD